MRAIVSFIVWCVVVAGLALSVQVASDRPAETLPSPVPVAVRTLP